jgi:hypothetical protein
VCDFIIFHNIGDRHTHGSHVDCLWTIFHACCSPPLFFIFLVFFSSSVLVTTKESSKLKEKKSAFECFSCNFDYSSLFFCSAGSLSIDVDDSLAVTTHHPLIMEYYSFFSLPHFSESQKHAKLWNFNKHVAITALKYVMIKKVRIYI